MQIQWRWHQKANRRGVNDANAMEVTMKGKAERRKRTKMQLKWHREAKRRGAIANKANVMEVTMRANIGRCK